MAGSLAKPDLNRSSKETLSCDGPLRHHQLQATVNKSHLSTRRALMTSLVLVLILHAVGLFCAAQLLQNSRGSLSRVQQCAIDRLHRNTSFLDDARPIELNEFVDRRNKLARALHKSGADAFVFEPGYTFQYYGNVSQTDWEPWEPEERPFLMLIHAVTSNDPDESASISFLAPSFEEARVRMLQIPLNEKQSIMTWEEHENPYAVLRHGLHKDDKNFTLMVDEEMRDYIVRGLEDAGFHAVGLSEEAEAVRQIKTPTEVEILRAVNTGTVEALRAMRPCLLPGLTESQVTSILDNALLSLGFQLFFNIVLFDENAASPHGGYDGSKLLTENTMVLIDVGAHYLGYSSDVCRSFFINAPPKSWLGQLYSTLRPLMVHSAPRHDPQYFQKVAVWHIVLEAQEAARAQMRPNNTAASVDIAAREMITNATYGDAFTHRVGHGIGIKAHESPYLHQGNTATRLRAGMTFTDEPGVYLEGKYGVRHEDVYLVKEHGEAENLSGSEAKSPWEP